MPTRCNALCTLGVPTIVWTFLKLNKESLCVHDRNDSPLSFHYRLSKMFDINNYIPGKRQGKYSFLFKIE